MESSSSSLRSSRSPQGQTVRQRRQDNSYSSCHRPSSCPAFLVFHQVIWSMFSGSFQLFNFRSPLGQFTYVFCNPQVWCILPGLRLCNQVLQPCFAVVCRWHCITVLIPVFHSDRHLLSTLCSTCILHLNSLGMPDTGRHIPGVAKSPLMATSLALPFCIASPSKKSIVHTLHSRSILLPRRNARF